MGSGIKRGVAAAGTVVTAAGVNVATGMLTQHWAAAWWAATIVLVVVGVVAQVWLTVADRASAGEESAGGRAGGAGPAGEQIISTGGGATNVQMTAEASGHGRVYQAGGDQTINER
jgi:hypothetical protein